MNTPRKGRKTCFRADTFDIVRETDMLDSDAQMVLDDLKNIKPEKTVADKTVTTFDREAEETKISSDGDQDEDDGENMDESEADGDE